jgi:hypothetical protein
MKKRDRSRLISVEISHEAKTVYDKQPHKGEYVSDAIIAKAQNSSGEIEARVEKLEKEVEGIKKVILGE